MSEPAFESVGLKEEADLAVSAGKWFSGLTVADATDSAAPLGTCSLSGMALIKIYLPPACTAEINNNTAGKEGKESLYAHEKRTSFFFNHCHNCLDNYAHSILYRQ